MDASSSSAVAALPARLPWGPLLAVAGVGVGLWLAFRAARKGVAAVGESVGLVAADWQGPIRTIDDAIAPPDLRGRFVSPRQGGVTGVDDPFTPQYEVVAEVWSNNGQSGSVTAYLDVSEDAWVGSPRTWGSPPRILELTDARPQLVTWRVPVLALWKIQPASVVLTLRAGTRKLDQIDVKVYP